MTTPHTLVTQLPKNFALRGLRELGFDMLKVIRSLKLSVNTSNNTVELP